MALIDLAITETEQNLVKNKLPENSLPINPTASGWSGVNVRRQIGASTKQLLEILVGKFDNLDSNIGELNNLFEEYSKLPLKGLVDPTSSTVGEYIGQFYVNQNSGAIYILLSIEDEVYTWVHVNTGENLIQSKILTLSKDSFEAFEEALFDGSVTLVSGGGTYYTLTTEDMSEYLDNLKYPAENFYFDGTLYGYSLNQRDLSISSTERQIIMGVYGDLYPYTNSVIFKISADGITASRGTYTAYGTITKFYLSNSYKLELTDSIFNNGYILIEALDYSKDEIFNCKLTDTVEKSGNKLTFYSGSLPDNDIKLYFIRLGIDLNLSDEIKIIEFPKTIIEEKSFSILSSATWNILSDSSPFNYYTDLVVNGIFGDDKIIDCIFNEKVKNTNYGIILYSITDEEETSTLRFYAINTPTENMEGVIFSHVKHD